MKKTLLLICLSLFLGIPVRAEEDIQALCKEQREKVDEAIKVISTIQDKSIKDYLYQEWVNPMLEDINKQADNNEKDAYLEFWVYYNSGLALALKKVDDRVQAYKKEYDNLTGWERAETVNPYEPLMLKREDGSWGENYYQNYISFYFSFQDKPNPKYTINDLRHHLQEYVDCTQLTKEGEVIKPTDRVVKFFNDNKLLIIYEPQECANLIIEIILEYKRVTHYFANDYNWINYFSNLWTCGISLMIGIDKNITVKEATIKIKRAVDALSPLKYNDVIVALNNEFKQKGMSDTQANKEAKKKLDNIIQIYANKLVEKARGGQSVQIKN